MIGDEIFQYGEKIEWIGHIKSVPRSLARSRGRRDSSTGDRGARGGFRVHSKKGQSQLWKRLENDGTTDSSACVEVAKNKSGSSGSWILTPWMPEGRDGFGTCRMILGY